MKNTLFINSLAAAVLAAAVVLSGCSIANSPVCRERTSMNNPVKIGWAKRSIAPENGVAPITGQFYLRVALGQATPVLTSAMVMENGKDSVIFVSADMVSVPSSVLKEVKANLANEAPEIPADKIIINATHTHNGPSAVGPETSPYPNDVEFIPQSRMREFIARQITDAVKEAWNKRDFGSIAYGYGFAQTGYSRRTMYLDDISKYEANRPGLAMNGRAKMYGNPRNDLFEGFEAGTDTFINIMYTFDQCGKLTGAVINVPCPSQTSQNTWELHASFWHNVREKLQAEYGDITIITQSAAAGDLSPQQLHYRAAEKRRFALKYPELMKKYMDKPMKHPAGIFAAKESMDAQIAYDCQEFLRAEDMGQRIFEAFKEVLSWAGKEKFSAPELKHEVRTLELSRRQFPEDLVAQERANHENFMKEKFISGGDKFADLRYNSILNSRRNRCGGVVKRYEEQAVNPKVKTDIHVVRIGNIAFATNRFELYMDYMHRIQGRSPFEQTFVVQLVTDDYGVGSYLATERAIANKGYSATPYCNQASPEGGQELVNATLDELYSLALINSNPTQVTVPSVSNAPSDSDWQKALVLKNFSPSEVAAAPAGAEARVLLLQDGKNLYVKTECVIPDAENAKFGVTGSVAKRDGNCWNYDNFEFFIADEKKMYQFIIAHENCLFDARIVNGQRTPGWNCQGIKISTRSTGKGWIGYMTIPLDELQLDMDKLRFNVYRLDAYSHGKKSVRYGSSYLSVYGHAYNTLKYFGFMKFAK